MKTIVSRCAAGLAACFAIALAGCNEWNASPSVPAFALQANAAQVELGSSLPLATTLADPSSFDFRWDFGDGSSSAEPNPSHVYASAGRYDISLIVSTRDGIQSDVKTSSVQVGRFAMVRGSSCVGAGGTGWCLQQPDASQPRPAVGSVIWSGTKTGLELGVQGFIQRTVDGGLTWAPTSVSGIVQLLAAGFADRGKGWLAGLGRNTQLRVFMTTDSGTIWAEQALPKVDGSESTDRVRPLTLAVVNANVAVINLNTSSLLTQDGGKVWSLQNYRHDAITLPDGTRWRLRTVGSFVTLMKSTDFGQTESAVLGNPYSIIAGGGPFFSDDAHAWVLVTAPGRQQVFLRTVDGGATWTEGADVSLVPSWAGDSPSISFFDTHHGWARATRPVGIYQSLLTTRDGGLSWTEVTSISSEAASVVKPLSARVAFYRTGIFPGLGNIIVLTEDEGVSWKAYAVPQESGAITEVELAADGAVRLCYSTRCFETHDQGTQWERVRGLASLPESAGSGLPHSITGIWFFDATHGIANATDQNTLLGKPSNLDYQTRDGGASWNVSVGRDSVYAVGKFQALSATVGWSTSGAEGLRKSIDAGTTWQELVGAPKLYDFHFIDARQGWGVKLNYRTVRPFIPESSTVYRTVDGGSTWQAVATVAETFIDIHFFDAAHGVVLGVGTLWRTGDGGATWQRIDQPAWISGVRYLDSNTMWARGSESGTQVLYRSLDGGASWQLVRLPSDSIRDSHFVSKDRGWLIGPQGAIFRTDDGGSTWTAQNSGVVVDLLAITGVDAHTLWVTGTNGTIIATATGGQ